MAVTTEYSTQYNNAVIASLPVKNKVIDSQGWLKQEYFAFTQGAAAGDANSLAYLVRLPPGNIRILPMLSCLTRSAFGAGRTLDIGTGAGVSQTGGTITAVVDNLLDGLDVSASGRALLGTGTNALAQIEVDSRDGIDIIAKVLGNTIPAAATLVGWITYVHNG